MIIVVRQLQEYASEQHKNIFVASVDLTKAFDTVNHNILLKKS